MRKLIYAINLTLDGCCDHTKGIAGEDVHEFFTELLHTADTFLYGRKTYELMVPFWPDVAKSNAAETKSMKEFADAFVAVKEIIVFSTTLTKSPDEKTRIVKGDLRDEVMKLKQQPGKPILAGGVDLPSQLIQLGLVDEFQFVVQPVLVGEGRRLLEGIQLQENVKFLDSTVLQSGSIVLRYGK